MDSLHEGTIEARHVRASVVIEKRLPGRRKPKVGVAVVVPVVVDVEALGIEVADVDMIAVRVEDLPAPIYDHQASRFAEGVVSYSYILPVLNVLRKQPMKAPSPEAGKKLESLSCFALYRKRLADNAPASRGETSREAEP